MRIAVKAALADVRKKKILVIRRSEGENWSKELWDLVGGGVEEGELLYDSLVRETKEETGIKLGKSVKMYPLKLWIVPERDLVGITFLIPLDEEKKVFLSEEHCEAKWIKRDEIKNLKAHKGIIEDLRLAFKMLERL